MRNQYGEVINVILCCLINRHCVGGRGSFKANGEKDYLLVWIILCDLQRIERRVDYSHITTSRLRG